MQFSDRPAPPSQYSRDSCLGKNVVVGLQKEHTGWVLTLCVGFSKRVPLSSGLEQAQLSVPHVVRPQARKLDENGLGGSGKLCVDVLVPGHVEGLGIYVTACVSSASGRLAEGCKGLLRKSKGGLTCCRLYPGTINPPPATAVFGARGRLCRLVLRSTLAEGLV